MLDKIHNFEYFSKLYESKNDGTSIIIGDSCTPLIFKKSKSLSILGNSGSESSLWKAGMGVEWLKNAVSKYQVTKNVKNVVINIGTNGAFSLNDDIKGLMLELRRVFPLARFIVVQGSWGWGNNKSVTPNTVKRYYDRFRENGAIVIDPPIGNVENPHNDLPIYINIAEEIDKLISEFKSGYVSPDNPSGSKIISRPDDVYKYKVENDHWLAKRDTSSRWYEITGADFKPAYQVSIDILDSENPTMRSKNAPKRNESQGDIVSKEKPPISSPPLPVEMGSDPEVTDAKISREFNFHIIPDGKETNYRSAQMPLEVMRYIYPKYNIKKIIRLNGNDNDGRHTKKYKSVSIQEEENLAKELGIKFYKLSATRDQKEIENIILSGNTLIHCAHGADRTGGNVGGYLYSTKLNPNLDTTEEIWKYTTKYNGWNSMVVNKPGSFEKGGYLKQAQKFGVKDIEQAKDLSRKYG